MKSKILIAALGLSIGAISAIGIAMSAGSPAMTAWAPTAAGENQSGDRIQLAQARGSYGEEPRGSYAGPPPKSKPKPKKSYKKTKRKKKSWGDTPVVSAPTGDTP